MKNASIKPLVTSSRVLPLRRLFSMPVLHGVLAGSCILKSVFDDVDISISTFLNRSQKTPTLNAILYGWLVYITKGISIVRADNGTVFTLTA